MMLVVVVMTMMMMMTSMSSSQQTRDQALVDPGWSADYSSSRSMSSIHQQSSRHASPPAAPAPAPTAAAAVLERRLSLEAPSPLDDKYDMTILKRNPGTGHKLVMVSSTGRDRHGHGHRHRVKTRLGTRRVVMGGTRRQQAGSPSHHQHQHRASSSFDRLSSLSRQQMSPSFIPMAAGRVWNPLWAPRRHHHQRWTHRRRMSPSDLLGRTNKLRRFHHHHHHFRPHHNSRPQYDDDEIPLVGQASSVIRDDSELAPDYDDYEPATSPPRASVAEEDDEDKGNNDNDNDGEGDNKYEEEEDDDAARRTRHPVRQQQWPALRRPVYYLPDNYDNPYNDYYGEDRFGTRFRRLPIEKPGPAGSDREGQAQDYKFKVWKWTDNDGKEHETWIVQRYK